MKILVFGAEANGKACKQYLEQTQDELVAFLDNDAEKNFLIDKNGNKTSVYRPEKAADLQYDQIWISNGQLPAALEMENQLKELHIPQEKVLVLIKNQALLMKVLVPYNQYNEETDNRVAWLRNFAGYAAAQNLAGNVAECGVCMGEFSYYINKYFPDKSLYLFDTFSGFDEQDLCAERSLNNNSFLDGMFNNKDLFAAANEQIVLARMQLQEKCILRKGYFPETAEGIEDQFCFVNLDMDLYQPMLAGLRFFYSKMCPGGVILMHDYFHPELPGVKQAVEEFEKEMQITLCKVPIGDFCSIAVIKHC